MVLVEFSVLDGNNGVDEIWRQLLVGHCLAILDVDLTEDFSVAIQDHTGRFHLLELVQVERVRLRFQIEEDAGDKNCQEQRQHAENGERNIKPGSEIPWWSKPVSRRRSKICRARRSQWLNGTGCNLGAKHPTLNVEGSLRAMVSLCFIIGR